MVRVISITGHPTARVAACLKIGRGGVPYKWKLYEYVRNHHSATGWAARLRAEGVGPSATWLPKLAAGEHRYVWTVAAVNLDGEPKPVEVRTHLLAADGSTLGSDDMDWTVPATSGNCSVHFRLMVSS